MTNTQNSALDIGHPAPQRHKAHPLLLLFALLGAPSGWMAQLLFAFASTSYLCFEAASTVIPAWLWPAIILLNIAGLAVGVAALMAGFHLRGRTADEHHDRSSGILDVGEGRTRFLAIWGIFISGAFIVATLANTLSLFLVPLCRA